MTSKYRIPGLKWAILVLTLAIGVCGRAQSSNTNDPPFGPISVSLVEPGNGAVSEVFNANIFLTAEVIDTNIITQVQFFSNSNLVATVTDSSVDYYSATGSADLYSAHWTNIAAGDYLLTAVASDSTGNVATSAPAWFVVSDSTNTPPSNIPLTVNLSSPTNTQIFSAPGTVPLLAQVTDTNIVKTVQYYATLDAPGSYQWTQVGFATNTDGVLVSDQTTNNPFWATWTNAPEGYYILIAYASDGNVSAPSTPLHIQVGNPPPVINTNPPPPPSSPYQIGVLSPVDGSIYAAPSDIQLEALVTGTSPTSVETVQYFVNSNLLTTVTYRAGTNLYFTDWTNVPAGNYNLTAVVSDAGGLTVTSQPVSIVVSDTSTNRSAVVGIFATDPVAFSGSNFTSAPVTSAIHNAYWAAGNTATFLVRRNTAGISDLSVSYTVGGTALNGVDYTAIANYVTIPAGQRYATVAITPASGAGSTTHPLGSVVLTLNAPANPLVAGYTLGYPASAGAVLIDGNAVQNPGPLARTLASGGVYLSLPAAEGTAVCLERSVNLIDWAPVCTNMVLKGSAQYVDPNAGSAAQFYRIVPAILPSF
jgi:hypothetical protein